MAIATLYVVSESKNSIAGSNNGHYTTLYCLDILHTTCYFYGLLGIFNKEEWLFQKLGCGGKSQFMPSILLISIYS